VKGGDRVVGPALAAFAVSAVRLQQWRQGGDGVGPAEKAILAGTGATDRPQEDNGLFQHRLAAGQRSLQATDLRDDLVDGFLCRADGVFVDHLEPEPPQDVGRVTGSDTAGELLQRGPAGQISVGDTGDGLGVVEPPVVPEQILPSASEAVLVQEGVSAQAVTLGDGGEDCIARDVGERHDRTVRPISDMNGVSR
jgi:hypothetical protein